MKSPRFPLPGLLPALVLAVKSWLGLPPNPTMTPGTGWILGGYWMPYRRETFVTPAFPAYISGHSTFSRAGAEVLARFTGGDSERLVGRRGGVARARPRAAGTVKVAAFEWIEVE